MKLENPYCTLADVQMECANHTPEAVEVLTNAINAASRYIDSECGRDFLLHDHGTAAYEVPPDHVGGCYLMIPWLCIAASEVSVTIDGVEVDRSEYRVSNSTTPGGVCYLIRSTPWIARNNSPRVALGARPEREPVSVIAVKGRFGYLPDGDAPGEAPPVGIPGNLRYACAVIAAVRSGKLKKEAVGQDGTRQTLTAKYIPKDVLAILDRMKVRTSF